MCSDTHPSVTTRLRLIDSPERDTRCFEDCKNILPFPPSQSWNSEDSSNSSLFLFGVLVLLSVYDVWYVIRDFYRILWCEIYW